MFLFFQRHRRLIIIIAAILIVIISATIILIYLRSSKETKGSPSNQTRYGPPGKQPPGGPPSEVTVEEINSSYKVASGKTSGWFKAGQEADLMLSGFDFNNAGGPLLFNHQGGIASDGKHLLLADRNNNRVLIWNSLPKKNQPPDLVLGQQDFTANNPGAGLDQLNWPISVATDSKHILVADTYNDRILIWNDFPTNNGEPADIELKGSKEITGTRGAIGWPWAVWTDGKKMIVASTAEAQVLIWNNLPTANGQQPDIVLKSESFGTPRTIGSDGTNLVVGDHNAFRKEAGNFFWKTFPTRDNQKYDFFMSSVATTEKEEQPQFQTSEIFWGPTLTPDGKLVAVGNNLYIWNKFPQNENVAPDLSVGTGTGINGYDFSGRQSGDGSSIAFAGEKLYISLCNGNKIVGFNSFPKRADQIPDFVIGSPDLYTNTLETEFIMSNPVPASDGKSLFVSSDFDRKMYVWKKLPDQSGAKPDFVYNLTDAPWDNALFKNTLALAGKQTVFIWKNLPLDGEKPDIILRNKIGSVNFQDLGGVAIDEKYFYLADGQANKIYVWKGLPDENSEPAFTINSDHPARISSDGEYLAVAATLSSQPGGSVEIYKVDQLPNAQATILKGMFNLPQGVMVYDGRLFVGDTGFNTVHIWNNIETAEVGQKADILLGEKGHLPQIGKGKLFWPAVPFFDGNYLWVGEFKFSERLLRFSPSP